VFTDVHIYNFSDELCLSDRLVTQNGLILMTSAAAFILMVTGSSVLTLVGLYNINVFITFSLSQAGMVRHWWLADHPDNIQPFLFR